MKSWKTAKLKQLARALRATQSEREMLSFLRDLCTPRELEEFAMRWHIAQRLHTGETYRVISAKTGISTTTVTRIAHWLEHGEGGYREALKRRK